MQLFTINWNGQKIPSGDTTQWHVDAQTFGTPAVPQPVFSNPGTGNVASNTGTPVVTTKNPDGSTASAHGQVPGTSVTINNPG